MTKLIALATTACLVIVPAVASAQQSVLLLNGTKSTGNLADGVGAEAVVAAPPPVAAPRGGLAGTGITTAAAVAAGLVVLAVAVAASDSDSDDDTGAGATGAPNGTPGTNGTGNDSDDNDSD